MSKRTLADLGWSKDFQKEFAPYRAQGLVPGRLIRDNMISYGALIVEDGAFEELEVVMSGKVYHDAATDAELPAVGDWVALDVGDENTDTVIRARLTRRTCFSRKVPGDSTEEQVMAANVDVVVVVTDAGVDYNPRRMERYFTLIARSGARPVVLLNKADIYDKALCEEVAAEIRQMNDQAQVHVISVLKKRGLKAVKDLFQPGVTVTVVGSSGVGKSALINYLLGGEYQWTGEVNEVTGKGRHTTTARELMVLRGGGIIVDNPGIKEVQMWTDEATLRERFLDIEQLAMGCKFSDCKHGSDAGCAIRVAVEDGRLDLDRYQGFLRLEDEITDLKQKQKKRQMTVERVAKREHRVKARNRADRADIERRQKRQLRAHEVDDEE